MDVAVGVADSTGVDVGVDVSVGVGVNVGVGVLPVTVRVILDGVIGVRILSPLETRIVQLKVA